MLEEIIRKIDHTNLSPIATKAMIETLCIEALHHKTASVCISPNYVRLCREKYPSLKLTTVIGFPNGYNLLEVKAYEARLAIRDGADELDMVMDLTHVKNGAWEQCEEELKTMRACTEGKVLKVIVETGALEAKELQRLCESLIFHGIDYIKTSTGFNFKEDPLEKVREIRQYIGQRNLKIKVSGGIRTKEDVLNYEGLEIDRFGASKLLANLLKMTK